jgi:lipoyl(octanoyl) transferase
MPPLSTCYLGRVPYARALALQEDFVSRVRRGEAGDTLLLLEHPAVITLGRNTQSGHVLVGEDALRASGIALHEAGRGGDVTFHGPGQLVGYPIVALQGARRDAHLYLRAIEEGLIATAAAYGICASRVSGLTGVWVGGAKLAAIGVRIGTGWVTSHGFALNVGPDLSGFSLIVPCGIKDKAVTSIALCTGSDPGVPHVARVAAPHIAAALGYEAVWSEPPLAAAFDAALSSSANPGDRP